jgi:hypothetical protein
MARVVDRARVLAAITHEETWENFGMTPDQLRVSLERHATRALRRTIHRSSLRCRCRLYRHLPLDRR